MRYSLDRLIDIIRDREAHIVLAGGNVYDSIVYDQQNFTDFIDFFVRLTELTHPQCLTYDIFTGLEIIRGDKKQIFKDMIAPETKPAAEPSRSPVAVDLAAAIRAARGSGSGDELELKNPLAVFRQLDCLLAVSNTPTAIIIDYADSIAPSLIQGFNDRSQKIFSVALTKWARIRKIGQKGHVVVLVARNVEDVDPAVSDRTFGAVNLRLPKPKQPERLEFIQETKMIGDKPEELSALSKATAGLSFNEVSKVISLCQKESDLDAKLDRIYALKRDILQDEYRDVVEIMEARNGFETIGGLENPIKKLRRIAQMMRQGNTTQCPQGALFIGPPGTGKTLLAEAFAKEARLNIIKFRDIKNMFVGESERRMTRALNVAKDLEPVIIFVDEFDQAQTVRGGFDGDSGVSRNLFKKMLEIMSDTSLRGKILWILATNRPDLIDPAIKRPGRCDLRIPFLPPDEDQLVLICSAAFKQYPDMKSEITDWRPYVKMCEGYTGAAMIEVIRRAWEKTCEGGRQAIGPDDMAWAVQDFMPQTVDAKMVSEMTLLAIAECSSRSLLPSNWRDIIYRYGGNQAEGIIANLENHTGPPELGEAGPSPGFGENDNLPAPAIE